MPLIKTVTDDSDIVRVVTKGGKPSCTCCGCDPELEEIYAEVIDNATSYVVYLTLTGSLNGGYFNDGDTFVTWIPENIAWDFGSFTYGTSDNFTSVRCDPSAVFSTDGGDFGITLSTTPLP